MTNAPNKPPTPKVHLRLQTFANDARATQFMVVVVAVLTLVLGLVPGAATGVVQDWGLLWNGIVRDAQAWRLLTPLLLPTPPSGGAPSALGQLVVAALTCYVLWVVGTSAERIWGGVRWVLVLVVGGLVGLAAAGLAAPGTPQAAAACLALAGVGADQAYLWRNRRWYRSAARQRTVVVSASGALLVLLNALLPVTLHPVGLLWAWLGGGGAGLLVAPVTQLVRSTEQADTLLGVDVNPLQRSARWLALSVSVGVLSVALLNALLLG